VAVVVAALFYLRWVDFQEAEQEAIAAFDEAEYSPALPSPFHWRNYYDRSAAELRVFFADELPAMLSDLRNTRTNPLATHLYRIAPAVARLGSLPEDALESLVHWLARQPFETVSDHRELLHALDILLLPRERHSGQHRTPMAVCRFLADLARPAAGESIYDPCFGTAGLLTAAIDYAREHSPDRRPRNGDVLRVTGVEVNSHAYTIGVTRLALSGVPNPQLELGNSLERPPLSNPGTDGFDLVLANPPWGGKVAVEGMDLFPVRSSDSALLFVQHALMQLRPGGRAVLIVPPNVLFASGPQQRLRQMLLEENTVEAVIALQEGTFLPYTAIKSHILVLRRGGRTRSVRMVDIHREKGDAKGDLYLLARSEELVDATFGEAPNHQAWNVDAEELATVEYDLTPIRRDQSTLQLILDSLADNVQTMTLSECCYVMGGRNIRLNDLTESPPASNYRPSGQTLFPDVEQAEIEPQRPFDFADTPIPYVRIKDVQKGEAARGSSWLMPAAASSVDPKWKLRAGDILLSKSGTIGKAGIVRNGAVGAIAASGFFVLRVKEDVVDPHYLLAYLQSNEVNAWLDDRARGAALRHLASGIIKQLPVVIPPLQIQRRVAEQCRKFGVDALTYLAALLSEDELDPIAADINSWVARSLRSIQDIEQGIRDLPPDGKLTLIEEIASSPCPVKHCQDCGNPYHLDFRDMHYPPPHDWAKGINSTCLACWLGVGPGSETVDSLSKHSPLIPWVFAFANAASPLRNISKIPDAAGVLSVLQSARAKLTSSLEKLKGHLPSEDRARQLTNKLWILVDTYSDQLTADVRVEISVKYAVENEGLVHILLEVFNAGALPLRNIEVQSDPWLEMVGEIEYLDRNVHQVVELQGRLHNELSSPLAMTFAWSAAALTGEQHTGTIDVLVDVDSEEAARSAVSIDLGASPYVCGDPIKPEREDVFKGRDEVLNQIRRQIIQSGNVVLLEGNRRAGKSSILWHLEGKDAVPGWLGVYCSLQSIDGAGEGGIPTAEVFRGIAYDLVQSMRRLNGSAKLPDGSILDSDRKLGIARALRQGISEEAPFQDFREYVEMILEMLATQRLGLLLMLDEFDKLQEGINNGITSPQVPENIRFLVQSYPKVSAILTGSRRLKRMREEYWSALFGLGTRIGISALPPDAAARLITEPVQGRLTFAKSAVERAYFLTAGQPYLLQCLCNRIFDLAAQSSVRSITIEHVKDAAKALVEDNEHFASLWDYTEFDRRRFLLYLLHRAGSGPDPMRLGVIEAKLEEAGVELREEVIMSDLEYLRELELVDLHGESSGAYYTLTIPLMGDWLESTHDFDVLRSRARAEAEDIQGKLEEIGDLKKQIQDLAEMSEDDDE